MTIHYLQAFDNVTTMFVHNKQTFVNNELPSLYIRALDDIYHLSIDVSVMFYKAFVNVDFLLTFPAFSADTTHY